MNWHQSIGRLTYEFTRGPFSRKRAREADALFQRRRAWDAAWAIEREGCIIGRHLDCNYLHPPSISIPALPPRTAVTVETASYHEERLYGTPPRLAFTFIRHRRPVFRSYPRNLRAIFRPAAGFDTSSDDRISLSPYFHLICRLRAIARPHRRSRIDRFPGS